MTPPSPPCFSKDVAKLGPMPSFAFTYLNLSCSCLHDTAESWILGGSTACFPRKNKKQTANRTKNNNNGHKK